MKNTVLSPVAATAHAVPVDDLVPTSRAPYTTEQHDRAEDPASAGRIEAHVDSILAALRAAVPTALAKTIPGCSSETAADIADDLTARLRANRP